VHENNENIIQDTCNSINEAIDRNNAQQNMQYIMDKLHLRQKYDQNAWVDPFGKGARPTQLQHNEEVKGPSERVPEQLNTMHEHKQGMQMCYWSEILQMEDLPFEGVFQLSETDLARLPAIENLGEYLKDIKISSSEDEDNSITFTRAKIVDICFGLGANPKTKVTFPLQTMAVTTPGREQ
jgi:hypothetical protein